MAAITPEHAGRAAFLGAAVAQQCSNYTAATPPSFKSLQQSPAPIVVKSSHSASALIALANVTAHIHEREERGLQGLWWSLQAKLLLEPRKVKVATVHSLS